MALVPVTMTGVNKDTIKEGFTKVNSIITDLADVTAGKGASAVGILDTAENFAATNVETALAEVYADHSASLAMSALFDEDPVTTTGATWGYKGGAFRNDNLITAVAAGTVSLTDDTTNYIEIGSDGSVYVVASAFTSGRIPIRTVVVSSGVQTVSTDKRAWFSAWPASFSAWTQTIGTFTAAPASTSTLTMTTDLTAFIKLGMSLKYVIGGVTKYGRVAGITNNLLTVNGAPLGGTVTALYYGGGTVRQVVVIIPGTYEDASAIQLIQDDLKSLLYWDLPTSYCVRFSVFSYTHDSGTHGQASVRINATELCTTAGGLTIAADISVYSTLVDIDVTAYDINFGEAIEISAVQGGVGDATYLTVEMIFITP